MSDTLNDLKARDVDNLVDITKRQCQVYSSQSRTKVQMVLAEVMRQVLLKFGFDLRKHARELSIPGNSVSGRAEEELARLHLKIEHRSYEAPEDMWRSGVYIYKGGEIIFFCQVEISEPKMKLFSWTPKYYGRFWSKVRVELR